MSDTDKIISAAEKLKECIWDYLEINTVHNDAKIRDAMNNLIDELEEAK